MSLLPRGALRASARVGVQPAFWRSVTSGPSRPRSPPDAESEANSKAPASGSDSAEVSSSAAWNLPPPYQGFDKLRGLESEGKGAEQEERDIASYVNSLRDTPIALGPPEELPKPTPTASTADKPQQASTPREPSASTSDAPSADSTDSKPKPPKSTDATPQPMLGPKADLEPDLHSPDADAQSQAQQEEWERKLEQTKAEWEQRMKHWRSAADNKTRQLLEQLGSTLSVVGLKVNEVTGYREVERLKAAVKDRESEISTRRQDVRSAKTAYEEAVHTLSSTQSNVNALLERKHSWTDADVAKFTQLVRSDHASRHAVATTSEELKSAELAVDKAFTALMQAILERYHEEQVWSDKIRSVSTWAQIAALVANLIVFVGAIAFIEPWKRRRLVQGLEERVSGMMGSVQGEIAALSEQVRALDRRMVPRVEYDARLPSEYVPAELAEVATLDETVAAAMGGAAAISQEELAAAEEAALSGEPLADAATRTEVEAATDELEVEAGAPSPLSYLAQGESTAAQAMAWVSSRLAYLAPPSPERDLAAAGVVGMVAGAAVIAGTSLLASLIRG